MALHSFKRCCRCEFWDDSGRLESPPVMPEHGRCARFPAARGVWTAPEEGCAEWELSTEILDALAKDLEFPRSERL